MADNVDVTPGTGATVSTEEVTTLNGGAVGAQHIQRVAAAFVTSNGVAQDVKEATPLPVRIGSGGSRTSITITRPNDTTAYAINDVVGGVLEFANLGVSGSGVMITGVELMIEASAIISGETTYRLHLYTVTPPSAIADNGAFDLPSGDRNSYVGYIDISSPVDLGSTLYVRNDGLAMPVKLSGTSLFGYLTTTTAYTPTALRNYRLALHTAGV